MTNSTRGFWQSEDGAHRPDALELVVGALEDTDALAGSVANLEPQAWGWPHRHFSGAWSDNGAPVVLKLDVSDAELAWAIECAEIIPELVPMLYATGDWLGQHKVRWILQERLPWVLSHAWPDGADVEMMIDTSVRFQKTARAVPVAPGRVHSEASIRSSLRSAIERGAPTAANVLLDALGEHWEWLTSTFGVDVIHGDLITPNVGVRLGPPARSDGVLLDLAAAHAPWPIEAAWPEGKNGQGCYRRLIPKMAASRRRHGLPVPDEVAVERANALVMGWAILGAHFARSRDVPNCPPDEVIDEYLSEAARAA